MIYVGNDGHVTDVPFFVHHGTDFVYSEIHLKEKGERLIALSAAKHMFPKKTLKLREKRLNIRSLNIAEIHMHPSHKKLGWCTIVLN